MEVGGNNAGDFRGANVEVGKGGNQLAVPFIGIEAGIHHHAFIAVEQHVAERVAHGVSGKDDRNAMHPRCDQFHRGQDFALPGFTLGGARDGDARGFSPHGY